MGREDYPGRTSEILFLDNRASGGLRVKSAPFLYWTDTSGPRVRRVAGALEADPEGAGEGRQEIRPPVCCQRPARLDSMRVEAVLRARSNSLGPRAAESPILGYEGD
jgi:hypothetical protein